MFAELNKEEEIVKKYGIWFAGMGKRLYLCGGFTRK